ncbi:MAG: hypothetical protein DRP81_03845, partial [Candidatus Omnitrophota bacterium]
MKCFLGILNIRTRRGISLIIAISIMVILALLGWTVANFLTSDFEVNVRLLDSERSLYVAESGVEWMFYQLAKNYDSVKKDKHYQHKFWLGEYDVFYRDSEEDEPGNIVVESTGSIPSLDNFRTQRKLKIYLERGNLERPVQAKHLFDWHLSSPYIVGDIGVVNKLDDDTDGYEGNGVLPHNEPVDINVPGRGEREFIDERIYPKIDLSYFETRASVIFTPPKTAKISKITVKNGNTILRLDKNIFTTPFTQWEGEILRDITLGRWEKGRWATIVKVLSSKDVVLSEEVDWEVGERVSLIPS